MNARRAVLEPLGSVFEDRSDTGRRERLRKVGVPDRAVGAVLEGLDETDATRAVRAFLETEDSFLVLAGPPGTGKTTAAALALDALPPERTGKYHDRDGLEQWMTRPRSVLFADAHELAQASNYDAELWQRLRAAHMLVIDDTGRELLDNTGRALGNLVNLLCRRHDDARRTILTTNLGADGWVKRYCSRDGGRLLDRLREQERQHGRSPFYAVAGGSLRGRTRGAS
jgi:DNA replication protein DnaC